MTQFTNVFRWVAAAAIVAIISPRLAVAQQASADDLQFFDQKVKPILQANCIKCHGAESKFKGGLRLTSRDNVLKGGDRGPIVEPGDADKSLLVSVLGYTGELKMPPKGKLPPEQISILTQWVLHGAAWTPGLDLAPGVVAEPTRTGPPPPDEARQTFWAFQPVKGSAVPQVKNRQWVRNPVDAFVLSKLEEKGLSPAPPATKLSLIRRATYDLTGLPPTPAEVDVFLADNSADAYEKLVDRLLASPHYGEKWARHWLDLVRYAESNSYERDNTKPNVWRYRDYVIRSLNADKPYDQFVREQLAGDEMASTDDNSDPIIATGFYRLGIWDDEPSDHLQARYDNLDDLVVTVGQVFMGLTIDCARCHSHKIDPIPQADYYRLLAFFQNVSNFHNGGAGDEVEIFNSPGDREKFRIAQIARKEKANQLQARKSQIESQFLAAYRKAESAPDQNVDIDDLHYAYYRDAWTSLPDFSNVHPETTGILKSGLFDISIRTRDVDFGFVFDGKLIVPADGDYTFYLDSDDGSRLTLDGKTLITYDGIHGEGKQKTAAISLKQGRLPIKLEYFQHLNGLGLTVSWKGPGFERRALSTPSQMRVSKKNKKGKKNDSGTELSELLFITGKQFLPDETYHEYGKLTKDLKDLEKPADIDRALCVSEAGPNAPDTFVCVRGRASVQGDKVEPGFPRCLTAAKTEVPKPASGAKTSGRRTVLASWITSNDNPMFARVMANRLFQYHFGRGIVRSPNNFGIQGDKPTHPELLEYLAAAFRDSGYRLKSMHRLLMLSNAYRMSSTSNPAALAADPTNDLLWRFDLRRLTAEEVRDSILAVNGTLNLEMFGPSVYPDIPAVIKAGQSIPGRNWLSSTPEQAARRSVYAHVKRSLQIPILSVFDQAEMDRSCPVRFVTVQPSQALGMVNGGFLNGEAIKFAARLEKEAGPDLTAQIKLAFRLATGREAAEADVRRSQDLMHILQERDGATALQARQLFCLAVLNLNEFMFVD